MDGIQCPMSNVGRRRRVAQKQMRVVISCMRVIVTNIQKNYGLHKYMPPNGNPHFPEDVNKTDQRVGVQCLPFPSSEKSQMADEPTPLPL